MEPAASYAAAISTTVAAPVSTAVAYATAIADAAPVSIPTVAAAISINPVISAVAPASTAPISVIPGASADENTTDEPVRAIVAIGRAGIRSVVVIAPRANRGRIVVASVIPVAVADGYANPHLGIGSQQSSGAQEQAEKQKVPKIFHVRTPIHSAYNLRC
jgi:hypothetical protein